MTSPVLWTLIAVQLALGLFDIVYHHEMMERLAWRVSQRRELKLHGARNLAYAVLFLALGLFELKGLWALFVIAVLVAELVITLVDFVQEDLSRKLPASERVTHTLLAINYGAILTLLVPVLVGWASQQTAIVPVWYGIGSMLAPLAAAGVIVFGLRDFFAARRMQRLVLGNAAELVRALPGRQCVLITGACGKRRDSNRRHGPPRSDLDAPLCATKGLSTGHPFMQALRRSDRPRRICLPRRNWLHRPPAHRGADERGP